MYRVYANFQKHIPSMSVLICLFCACTNPLSQSTNQSSSLPQRLDQRLNQDLVDSISIDSDMMDSFLLPNDVGSFFDLSISDQTLPFYSDNPLDEAILPHQQLDQSVDQPSLTQFDSDVAQGMTAHLRQWLANRIDERATQIGLSIPSLARPDLMGGAFGGFFNADDQLQHTPILFIHGNSDRALGGELGGWSIPVNRFKEGGYRSAELYATTYGPARVESALTEAYQHSVENVLRIRLFIELILDYTGAEHVNVIAHSLGTTIARRALLGGMVEDQNHQIDLGPPLTHSVKTFISIAGAHLGLSSCYFSASPVCSADLGLYPGQLTPLGVVGRSRLLETLNASSGYEGQFRISLWSPTDELVGGVCLVWGLNTCQLPEYTDDYRLPGLSHLEVRDQTTDLQFDLMSQ